jgi:hypothetical protein
MSGDGRKLKVFVSSTVVGYEPLLRSLFALLVDQGFEPVMSCMGTVPVNSDRQAYEDCLEAMEECDLFLGIIFPRYGSGSTSDEPLNITHREMKKAIDKKMPRWFMVHEQVVIATTVLKEFRDPDVKDRFALRYGHQFKGSPFLDDLRIIDMHNLVLQREVQPVSARKGNWVQTFGDDYEAKLFVSAQFRGDRELFQKLRDQMPPGQRTDTDELR